MNDFDLWEREFSIDIELPPSNLQLTPRDIKKVERTVHKTMKNLYSNQPVRQRMTLFGVLFYIGLVVGISVLLYLLFVTGFILWAL